MPFLSQISVDQMPAIVAWLVGASGAIFLVNQVLTFWKEHMREQPSPAGTYATRAEHRDLATRMDTELGRERSSRKRMHEEIAALQGEIQGMRADASGRANQLSDLAREVNEINRRIDDVPRRTIGLLKETKDLHSA